MALRRRRMIIEKDVTPPPQEVVVTEQLPSFEGELNRLYLIANRPLSLLNKEQQKDLNFIKKIVQKTYSTKNYPILYEKILSIFKSGDTFTFFNYQPLTVGAVFLGCLVPTNIQDFAPDINEGCSIMCSDSIPPPHSSGGDNKPWGFCSQNVLWCVKSSSAVARNSRNSSSPEVNIIANRNSSSESFDFIFVNRVSSSSKAIIFVDFPTYQEFPGFTKSEKASLTQVYITDIKLFSYEKIENGETSSMKYKDLIGKVSKVYAIKSRADPRDGETLRQRISKLVDVKKTSSSWQQPLSTRMVIALFLLVIIVICCGLMIKYLKYSTTPNSNSRSAIKRKS